MQLILNNSFAEVRPWERGKRREMVPRLPWSHRQCTGCASACTVVSETYDCALNSSGLMRQRLLGVDAGICGMS